MRWWEENDTFQESLRQSEGRPIWSFYDGPPFATGLPHYGHILAGTIKDVVTRYACAKGFHVPRRFGWDCHGLPVEFEAASRVIVFAGRGSGCAPCECARASSARHATMGSGRGGTGPPSRTSLCGRSRTVCRYSRAPRPLCAW